MFLLTALFAGGLVASLWAPSAYADNTLASSNPSLGETVDSFAGPITLTFTNPLGPNNDVTMTCNGSAVTLGDAALQQDGVTLSVPLGSAAPKGDCVIAWVVTDINLQPAGSSSITFTVANDPVAVETTVAEVTTSLAPGETTPSTIPPNTVPKGGVGGGSGSDTNSTGPLGLFRLVSNFGLAGLLLVQEIF